MKVVRAWLRRRMPNEPEERSQSNGSGNSIAQSARQIIERRFQETDPCTTRAIARRLGVSRSHLCHCYRDRYDSTISEDVRERRIALARRLIREDPDALVKEIAASVGFRRRSYRTFLNAFRKETGMSPRAFRRRVVTDRIAKELDDSEDEPADRQRAG